MTRLSEMVPGEVTGMMVIVIEMGAARESTAETGTGTGIEKAGEIEEAKVENDTASLLLEGTIKAVCHQGGAAEGEKAGLTCRHRCLLHHHHPCMDRMNGGELDMELDLQQPKDRVEVVMVGATTTEKTAVAVAGMEVEMMTCHRGSMQEAKKVLHMAVAAVEGEVDEWQVTANDLGEGHEYCWLRKANSFLADVCYIYPSWRCVHCIADLGMWQGV